METKHTKGEWTIQKLNFEENLIVSDEYVIAKFETGKLLFDDKFEKEQEANAKLIAAAPDLLKALIEISEELPKPSLAVTKIIKEIANNAINKATK